MVAENVVAGNVFTSLHNCRPFLVCPRQGCCNFGPKLRSLLKQKILRLSLGYFLHHSLNRRQNLARYILSLCFRTCHSVSEPVTLFQNPSLCFRTRHSVSQPVIFTTCHSVSQPVTLFQNLSLCFRTCHSVSDQKAGLQMWT